MQSNSREIEHPAGLCNRLQSVKILRRKFPKNPIAPSSCCFCALSEISRDKGSRGMFELSTEIRQIVRTGVGSEVLLADIQDLREGCAPRGGRLSPLLQGFVNFRDPLDEKQAPGAIDQEMVEFQQPKVPMGVRA